MNLTALDSRAFQIQGLGVSLSQQQSLHYLARSTTIAVLIRSQLELRVAIFTRYRTGYNAGTREGGLSAARDTDLGNLLIHGGDTRPFRQRGRGGSLDLQPPAPQ